MMNHRRLHAAVLAASLISLALPAPVFADASAPSFTSLIEAGRADALADRPQEALTSFQTALAAAHGGDEERVARFGIGRMLLWLGRYDEASTVYETLLQSGLDPADKQIALAGEVKSLAYRNRPRSAYRATQHSAVTSSDLAIATAQAASWSGWSDKARDVLVRNRNVIAQLPPGSSLAQQARSIIDNVHRDTSTGVSLTDAYSHDSDGLSDNDVVASVRQPLGRTTTVDATARRFDLHSDGWALQGTETRVGVELRPADAVSVVANAGQARYDGWNAPVWSGEIAYQSSDQLRIAAYGQGEVVETRSAIADRITAETTGATVQVVPMAPVTVSAGAFGQRFSDGNVRHGLSGTVALAALPAVGVGVEFRERMFSDRYEGAAGYFSPGRYDEQEYLLTFRRRVHGWQFDGLGGIGHRITSGQAPGTTSIFALSARGPLGGCLRLEASVSSADSAVSSASGYRRTAASLGFSCAL